MATSQTKQAKSVAIRAYKLRLYGNPGKIRQTLGNMLEYRAWLWDYVTRYYGKGEDATESTKGRGWIANRAFKRARDLLRAGRHSSIATGAQFNRPESLPLLCEGNVEESCNSSWDYWIKVHKGPRLPVQTHRALKNALRRGGKLRRGCEIRQSKQGWLYVLVFVEFTVPHIEDTRTYFGCDVGVNAGVARSDGYVSRSLRLELARNRQKRAEQRKQGHVRSSARSAVKQILDREARKAVNVCLRSGRSLAVERLNALGNLRPSGSIGAWARSHFAKRCLLLAEETGVAVIQVFPAYTSQTCPRCDHCHAKNRRGTYFECLRCGYVAHADVIGARNIARKAAGTFLQEGAKAGIEIWGLDSDSLSTESAEKSSLTLGIQQRRHVR